MYNQERGVGSSEGGPLGDEEGVCSAMAMSMAMTGSACTAVSAGVPVAGTSLRGGRCGGGRRGQAAHQGKAGFLALKQCLSCSKTGAAAAGGAEQQQQQQQQQDPGFDGYGEVRDRCGAPRFGPFWPFLAPFGPQAPLQQLAFKLARQWGPFVGSSCKERCAGLCAEVVRCWQDGMLGVADDGGELF